MPNVPLITDAAARPGPSFSRFVLPFAYWPEHAPGPAGAPCYHPAERPNERLRQRYLTPETSHVLFERALWLELRDAPHTHGQRRHRLPRDPESEQADTIEVRVAPARLLLFEWPDSERVSAASDDRVPAPDLLHTGFLIRDVDFVACEGRAPTLARQTQFNELFRWWQRPWEGYGKDGWLDFMGHAATDDEPALYLEPWAELLDHPLVDRQGQSWRLFPAAWAERARHRVPCLGAACPDERCQPTAHEADWAIYPDTRAWVWTCATVARGGHAMAPDLQLDALPREWVRFLNVDTQTRGDASDFEVRWAKEHTYDRWLHAGTLYGFCSHAGALLANADPGLPLHRHFAELYFDQTLLLLYLRATTLRVSRTLSAISSRARDAGSARSPDFQEEFQRLREAFALFTNLYRFPLISHQQQGIELYLLARRSFDVEELFAEVQSEVHTTDEFLSGVTQVVHAATATRLTVVATVALGLGLGLDFLQVEPVSTLRDVAKWCAVLLAGGTFFLALVGLVMPVAKELAAWFQRIERYPGRIRERITRHASSGPSRP